MNINKTNKFVRYALMSTLFASAFFNSDAAPKNANSNAKQETTKAPQATTPKVAYVYLGKIMTMDASQIPMVASEWKDLYANLQNILSPIDSEMQKLEEQYKKGRTDFESLRNSNIASREALQRKAEEVGKIEFELRNKFDERERFVQEELIRMQSAIAPKVEQVVKQLMTEQGWDVIERGENALIIAPEYDLTSQVLARLNSSYDQLKKEEAEKKTQDKSSGLNAKSSKEFTVTA